MASNTVKPKYVVAYTTAPNEPSSERLARELVKSRAAACVQQIPGMKATYWWKGEIHTDREELLLIKTSTDKIDAIKEQLAKHHPYDTPELVVAPIVDGSEKYLKWIDDNTINAPSREVEDKK